MLKGEGKEEGGRGGGIKLEGDAKIPNRVKRGIREGADGLVINKTREIRYTSSLPPFRKSRVPFFLTPYLIVYVCVYLAISQGSDIHVSEIYYTGKKKGQPFTPFLPLTISLQQSSYRYPRIVLFIYFEPVRSFSFLFPFTSNLQKEIIT